MRLPCVSNINWWCCVFDCCTQCDVDAAVCACASVHIYGICMCYRSMVEWERFVWVEISFYLCLLHGYHGSWYGRLSVAVDSQTFKSNKRLSSTKKIQGAFVCRAIERVWCSEESSVSVWYWVYTTMGAFQRLKCFKNFLDKLNLVSTKKC